MKKLTLILSIVVIFIFSLSTIIAASENLYKEKLAFINQVLGNPDDFKSIFKTSQFYDDSLFGGESKWIDYSYEYELKKYIKQLSGKSIFNIASDRSFGPRNITLPTGNIQRQWVPEEDDRYLLSFLGDIKNAPFSIAFIFVLKNNKWILENISNQTNYYLYSTKEDADKATLNNQWNQDTINFKNKKYFNQDYKTAEKLDFVSKLIHFPDDVESLIRNSEFNPGDLYSDSSFRNNLTVLKNYLAEFKDSCRIWLNYPFPLNDIHIEKYLNSDQPKDYFVIEYYEQTLVKRIDIYLTIEFEQNNSKWYINKITKGTLVFISPDGYNYMKPTANKQDK